MSDISQAGAQPRREAVCLQEPGKNKKKKSLRCVLVKVLFSFQVNEWIPQSTKTCTDAIFYCTAVYQNEGSCVCLAQWSFKKTILWAINLYFVKSGIRVTYKEIKTFSFALRFWWRSVVDFWAVKPYIYASDKFLPNAGNCIGYTVLQPRRPQSA